MLREKLQRSRDRVLFNSIVLAVSIGCCPGGPAAQTPAAGPLPNHAAAGQPNNETKFPVALQHLGSWCYGYLYASQERIRFEVVQPQSDKNLSFEAPRSEVTAGQWLILGMPQDAIELNAKTATYHMRLLANESEVKTGSPRRWGPHNSLPPDPVLAAIQNPGASLPPGLAPGTAQGPAPAALAGDALPSVNTAQGGAPAPANNEPRNVPPGMLAGAYVATAGRDARPSNTQYLFYPDGFVLNAVPQSGTLTFDLSHYRQQDNRDKYMVGRYKVEGNDIKILWIDEYTDPAHPDEIERNETSAHPSVRIGPQIFIPMCHCTGKTLSGIYLWGSPNSGQYIQFNPDGTFFDNRATDQILAISFDHPRVQNGRYQIVDQTIIFTFPDGHRGTSSFLAPKVQQNDPAFEWIDLGWNMLFEQRYHAKLSQGW